MQTNPIQFTTHSAPEGCWRNAKGGYTPVDLIKEIDIERDALVREIVMKSRELNQLLRNLKLSVFGDVEAFKELSAEKYGVELGGKKGNVTLYSFDGEHRVNVAISEQISFDERLQAAKTLIDECLTDWTQGARPEIHSIIDDAFAVDKQGKINTKRVLELRRLDITDERWLEAMKAIGDSIQIIGSRQYIRVYERVGDNGQYQPIALDIAGV
ncbi:DUF3164 family protein [Morganella morganii subsp. sibonii]